ncbi:MAG TPA: hypothetical protein VGG48_18395 [Rhizomicrobium sp.]|jgi:hypothetical protein
MHPAARLDDRAVIALFGPDARSLLQGLITNDVDTIAPGMGLYAALLTPQGKILYDFLLTEGDGAILIDCLATARDVLLKRLRMYRLRAKVEIEARDQLAVFVGLDAGNSFADPRHPGLGRRSISARQEMPQDVSPASAYHAHRLDLGIPEGDDFGQDKIFALDGGLDELHAVSFTKGCYVGQELTARMKHRGTARKRLLPIEGDGLQPGAALKARLEIGSITTVYGHRGFALVRLDRLAEAGDAAIESGGATVRVIKPSWISLDV